MKENVENAQIHNVKVKEIPDLDPHRNVMGHYAW